MHDIPYLKLHIGQEIVAAMTAISQRVKDEAQLPCGIQILSGANKEAIAVANAAGLDFVRVEGFVFAHIADEGLTESCAGELLRYRKMIGADNILVFTDIKKKHCSHAVTSDVDIVLTAKAAEFFLSDGIIVTGAATGLPAEGIDVENVRQATQLPVLVGSGVNVDNINDYRHAHGVIVGSHFKKDGVWSNSLDYGRINKFMRSFLEL